MSVETEFMGVAETLKLAVLACHTEWFAVVQAALEVSEVTTIRRDEITAGKGRKGRTALTFQ
jgi:hypothetical protein